MDRIDSKRLHGVPIIYVPRISEAAKRHPKYNADHPMPSSDLILAEHGCSSHDADGLGGRIVRVRTCVPGWVCIVCAQ